MKKALTILAAGLMLGAFAATQAKLPPPPPKTDAQKAAEADKAKASKAKDDADLAKAQDRTVSNYKKNHAAMGKK
jgi:uncharacterized lipoprotein YajG